MTDEFQALNLDELIVEGFQDRSTVLWTKFGPHSWITVEWLIICQFFQFSDIWILGWLVYNYGEILTRPG